MQKSSNIPRGVAKSEGSVIAPEVQKDDVLYLEHEVKHPISIEVNGVKKFTGFQGAYKGHKAINIHELIYEPVEADEMFV